ncbi:MAG: AAC(3) family N-acetyltransferase [Boseongicola sp.]
MTDPHQADSGDIAKFLAGVGIGAGSTILVHSSWTRLSSSGISLKELLSKLRQTVGESGTIMMPAFPADQDPSKVFSVKRSPSGAGLLTEAFRRSPGVCRSVSLNHSVCAAGPNAEFLTQDHHLSVTSWDEKSPYFRLHQLPDSWVVGLGVGHRLKTATPLHCVESTLISEVDYFESIFPDEVTYSYSDKYGAAGQHTFRRRVGVIYPAKLARHFTKDELIETCVKGLDVYAIRSDVLHERSTNLAYEGKTMYIWPIPWPWRVRRRR